MTRLMQACLFGSVIAVVSALPGCGPDNQSTAKIQGVVPTDGKTDQERKAAATGLSKPENYNPSSGNQRNR